MGLPQKSSLKTTLVKMILLVKKERLSPFNKLSLLKRIDKIFLFP